MTTSAPTLTLRCNRVGRQRRHADLRRACNFAMAIGAFGILVSSLQATNARAQNKLPLQLVQTILMPNVHGRMDHLGADVEGERLFAAALSDTQNTVEVIDLKAGKRVFSIRGQSMPQGVFYSTDFKRLFVTNGKDGSGKIFRGDNFELIDSLSLGTNANHVGYDPGTNVFMSELAFQIQGQERWLLSIRAPINTSETSKRIPTPVASRSGRRGREFS